MMFTSLSAPTPSEAVPDADARSLAHFATRHEKFVMPGIYPSFAHITISSLLDRSVNVQRVAITYGRWYEHDQDGQDRG